MRTAEFPPIEGLIPHRGDSLLLDCVLEHDDESTSARVVVGASRCLEKADGTIAAWAALEYMSQCVAAHENLLAPDDGSSRIPGYLTAVVGLRLHRSHFEAGERLRVRTRRTRGRLGLGAFSHFCTIHLEGETGEEDLLAEGRLTISIPRAARNFAPVAS
ncbi:MAG: beta-hydroxyacyl-ACP dehydratase [Deltaproteobacteria bacterium]|jgi:predicted hotdog family 3-hydroxylacyl-ACP dehydratase|nr:beta-hydroxyacyl-ACP dehydratase [Deltaproteobacteria bacterium]